MTDMFSRLRTEAERVNAANKMVLFQTKGRQGLNSINQFSGHDAKMKLGIGGLGLGMGSSLGMVGVAMANQAAALGSAGLLASASTALAGLGTVTLGAAVLPVATVVTLGGAVAGVAIFGASRLMKVDVAKGFNLQRALERGDQAKFENLSKETVELRAWFKGAKNLLVNTFRQHGQEEEPGHIAEVEKPGAQDISNRAPEMNYVVEYELLELFGGGSPEIDKQLQLDMAAELSAKIWNQHGIVVTEDKIHSCLGRTRENETTYGKIVGIDKQQGLVIQSIGRGQATIHKLEDFAVEPKIGNEIMVSYRGGQLRSPQEKDMSQAVAVGR